MSTIIEGKILYHTRDSGGFTSYSTNVRAYIKKGGLRARE
jgi:hypothetical protein